MPQTQVWWWRSWWLATGRCNGNGRWSGKIMAVEEGHRRRSADYMVAVLWTARRRSPDCKEVQGRRDPRFWQIRPGEGGRRQRYRPDEGIRARGGQQRTPDLAFYCWPTGTDPMPGGTGIVAGHGGDRLVEGAAQTAGPEGWSSWGSAATRERSRSCWEEGRGVWG